MAKNTLELKNAIQNLKINRPFDLRGQKQVTLQPPQIEQPRNEVPQNEDAQSEMPQSEVLRIEDTQKERAYIRKALEFLDESELLKGEVTQNEDTQIEVPQNDEAKGLGFFMLSHGNFADPRMRQLPGDSFRIYLWMSCNAWRYRDSTGFIRAAVGYISVGTGVLTATVSRCLQILREENLIRLVQTDFKRGNT